MKKASDYFFLEQVPNTYPMDVLFIELGHLLMSKRSEFGIQDSASMILSFQNGSVRLFQEREKWFINAEKILRYTLQSDENVATCLNRIERWTEYTKMLAELYMKTDFSMYQDASLCLALDTLLNTEKTNGIQNADIMSTNYGTNLIHKELEKTLKELGFAPHAIIPILLRTTKKLAVIEYEKALGELVLGALNKNISKLNNDVLKNNKELSDKVGTILSNFGWLDSSFGADPKSVDAVIREANDLLSFGNDLPRILSEREKIKSEKEEEQKKVMAGVLEKASQEQKRIITFACRSTELGGVLVDEIMKFVYYRRGIYKEFGKRLNLREIDVKYLLPDELKDLILSKSPASQSMQLIEERKKLTLFVLENDAYTLHTGAEAEKLQQELIASISDDDKPLKGEIAFSAGKVKGIARLVNDTHDMDKVQEGDILVSSRTYPDLLPAMRKSKAIIAELGGLLSHAAIVSRELHIPCVVGVRNATSRIKDGDEIEVDTVTGAIVILEKK